MSAAILLPAFRVSLCGLALRAYFIAYMTPCYGDRASSPHAPPLLQMLITQLLAFVTPWQEPSALDRTPYAEWVIIQTRVAVLHALAQCVTATSTAVGAGHSLPQQVLGIIAAVDKRHTLLLWLQRLCTDAALLKQERPSVYQGLRSPLLASVSSLTVANVLAPMQQAMPAALQAACTLITESSSTAAEQESSGSRHSSERSAQDSGNAEQYATLFWLALQELSCSVQVNADVAPASTQPGAGGNNVASSNERSERALSALQTLLQPALLTRQAGAASLLAAAVQSLCQTLQASCEASGQCTTTSIAQMRAVLPCIAAASSAVRALMQSADGLALASNGHAEPHKGAVQHASGGVQPEQCAAVRQTLLTCIAQASELGLQHISSQHGQEVAGMCINCAAALSGASAEEGIWDSLVLGAACAAAALPHSASNSSVMLAVSKLEEALLQHGQDTSPGTALDHGTGGHSPHVAAQCAAMLLALCGTHTQLDAHQLQAAWRLCLACAEAAGLQQRHEVAAQLAGLTRPGCSSLALTVDPLSTCFH